MPSLRKLASVERTIAAGMADSSSAASRTFVPTSTSARSERSACPRCCSDSPSP